SSQDFVGGASVDDLASVAVMRIGREGSSLQGNKAWFFLPDAIVCLGCGISADEDRPAETIVESARLERDDLAVSIDGRATPAGEWQERLENVRSIHLAGTRSESAIGWWFPRPAQLLAERSTRQGS